MHGLGQATLYVVTAPHSIGKHRCYYVAHAESGQCDQPVVAALRTVFSMMCVYVISQ